MKIFVSFASYRDSQLIPSLHDFIQHESNQHQVVYGVCLQDTKESLHELQQTFPNRQQVKIIYLHYTKAKGVCWARRLLQDAVTDEDFILQMDSHMRSIPSWDEALIASYKATGVNKAVLSSYPPHYALNDTSKSYLNTSIYMNVTRLNLPVRKKTTLHGCAGDYLNTTGKPIRNIHMAGGFYFAPTRWIQDSPYPKDLYFEGEEDTMTLLSYTHGWTVFCPEKAIIYHSYTNNLSDSPEKYRPLHWEDHPGGMLNANQFHVDRIKVGTKRTVEDYFKELNQFTDNYKQFELHYQPREKFIFQLLDKDKKTIYTKYSPPISNNILEIDCTQELLHSAYSYTISKMENDPIHKTTRVKHIFYYSFIWNPSQ